MMRARRRLIGLAAIAPFSGTFAATRPSEVRIGVLTSGARVRAERLWEGLTAGLAERGYVEGRNLEILRYQGMWPDEGMARMARTLVDSGVDAIVTACGWTTGVAFKTTRSVPIVMATVTNPLGYGFVKSLARPGTNVTGRSGSVDDLGPKMIGHLHAVVPSARRIGAIVNPGNPLQHDRLREAAGAAAGLGLRLIPIALARIANEAAARAVLVEERVDAVMALPDDDMHYMTHAHLLPVTDGLRIPTIFPKSDKVEGGEGFMSYGPDQYDAFRRSVSFIERIANGARVEDLPVEQPMRLELAISLRKAASLGITVPKSALLRADLVIR